MSIRPGIDERSLEAHIEHTRGRAPIRQVLGIVAVAVLGSAAAMNVESRAITVQGSSLTVFVYKTGLFSAFADNHVIRAPLAEGSVSEDPLSPSRYWFTPPSLKSSIPVWRRLGAPRYRRGCSVPRFSMPHGTQISRSLPRRSI